MQYSFENRVVFLRKYLREPLKIPYRAKVRNLHVIILPKPLEIRQYSCGVLTTFCHKSSALLHDIELLEIPLSFYTDSSALS